MSEAGPLLVLAPLPTLGGTVWLREMGTSAGPFVGLRRSVSPHLDSRAHSRSVCCPGAKWGIHIVYFICLDLRGGGEEEVEGLRSGHRPVLL